MNMTLRKSVALVALLNLSYFVVEFLFSHLFDSLSLLSDSLDFLEDASINLLILIAFSWSLLARILKRIFRRSQPAVTLPADPAAWSAETSGCAS